MSGRVQRGQTMSSGEWPCVLPLTAYVYTLMKVGLFRINLHPSKSNSEQMLCCVSTALRMQGNSNHLLSNFYSIIERNCGQQGQAVLLQCLSSLVISSESLPSMVLENGGDQGWEEEELGSL